MRNGVWSDKNATVVETVHLPRISSVAHTEDF